MNPTLDQSASQNTISFNPFNCPKSFHRINLPMLSVGEGGKDIIAVDVEAMRWLGMVGILMARLSDEKRGGESTNYWSDLLYWNYGNGRSCRKLSYGFPADL